MVHLRDTTKREAGLETDTGIDRVKGVLNISRFAIVLRL